MNRGHVALVLAAAALQGATFAILSRLLQRQEPRLAQPARPAADVPPALSESLVEIERRLSVVESTLAQPAPRPEPLGIRTSEPALPTNRQPSAATQEALRLVPGATPHQPADITHVSTADAWQEFPRQRSAASYLDEGNVYVGVGQHDRAVERFTRALQIQPDLGSAYFNRAIALSRLDRIAEAIVDYDRAAALLPDDADVLINRGLLRFGTGDIDAAEQDLRTALQLAPEDAAANLNLGLLLLETGRSEAALACLQQAVFHEPDSGSALYALALALAAAGRHDEAAAELGHALRLAPELAASARDEPRFDGLYDHSAPV